MHAYLHANIWVNEHNNLLSTNRYETKAHTRWIQHITTKINKPGGVFPWIYVLIQDFLWLNNWFFLYWLTNESIQYFFQLDYLEDFQFLFFFFDKWRFFKLLSFWSSGEADDDDSRRQSITTTRFLPCSSRYSSSELQSLSIND